MPKWIYVPPLVTIQDIDRVIDAEGLNVDDFLAAMEGQTGFGEHDEREVRLRAALHCVADYRPDLSREEWLEPYLYRRVDPRWLRIVRLLNCRGLPGSSVLDRHYSDWHSEEQLGAEVFVPRRSAPAGERLVLRTHARTLEVLLEYQQGDAKQGRIAPPKADRFDRDEVEALAHELIRTISLQVGGSEFLEPDLVANSLSVLAATLVTILQDGSSMRWLGRRRVVRKDVYLRVLKALGVDQFSRAVRMLLERRVPDPPPFVPRSIPWPPGSNLGRRPLTIFDTREGLLLLDTTARLETF